MSPRLRRHIAAVHVLVALVGGAYSSVVLATDGYQRVLMGISWYAILATAADIWQTTDVRAQQETSP